MILRVKLTLVLKVSDSTPNFRLIKKPTLESTLVLKLIATGKARSTKQAEKLVRQNGYHNCALNSSFEGYSIGDWVEVIDPDNSCYGERGRVELLMPVEGLVSVSLEEAKQNKKFSPQELALLGKAPLPCPYRVGELVRIDIDSVSSIEALTRKYNGLWGIVLEIGELGSVKVDVGSTQVQLLPFDLQPIDNPSPQLEEVAHRLLRLRKLSLDEIEEKMLDVLQAREWFTARQLVHLENIEKLYSNGVCLSSGNFC